MSSLLVHGITEEHKDWLYAYAEKELGTRSMTKAILALINEKMQSGEKLMISPEQIDRAQPQSKKRIQISLREHDYNILNEIAINADTSITYYIIRLILNNIYSANIKLLGTEIEQLRRSNYEIHKVGVNINQIAKNLNNADLNKNNKNLASFYIELDKTLKQHLEKIRVILESSLTKY
jgi:hypothetical protein